MRLKSRTFWHYSPESSQLYLIEGGGSNKKNTRNEVIRQMIGENTDHICDWNVPSEKGNKGKKRERNRRRSEEARARREGWCFSKLARVPSTGLQRSLSSHLSLILTPLARPSASRAEGRSNPSHWHHHSVTLQALSSFQSDLPASSLAFYKSNTLKI